MDRTSAAHPARPGDTVALHPHHLGEPERHGEIVEVIGDPGHEHFRVRWEDEHESVIYPGSDAIVRPSGREEEMGVSREPES